MKVKFVLNVLSLVICRECHYTLCLIWNVSFFSIKHVLIFLSRCPCIGADIRLLICLYQSSVVIIGILVIFSYLTFVAWKNGLSLVMFFKVKARDDLSWYFFVVFILVTALGKCHFNFVLYPWHTRHLPAPFSYFVSYYRASYNVQIHQHMDLFITKGNIQIEIFVMWVDMKQIYLNIWDLEP